MEKRDLDEDKEWKTSQFQTVPPSYVYQSPYLAAAAPGGLVPLPATQLSHAAAVAATQFYDYQNVAAAAATYPGTSYNFAEAYPYTSAAAAGTLENPQERKDIIILYQYVHHDRQDHYDDQDHQDHQDHQNHQDHQDHQNHHDHDHNDDHDHDHHDHYDHHYSKDHDFIDLKYHNYIDDKEDDPHLSDYIAYLKHLDRIAYVKHQIYVDRLDYLACRDYQNYQYYKSYLNHVAFLYRQNCKYYQQHYSQKNDSCDHDFSNVSDNSFGQVPGNDRTPQPWIDQSNNLSNLKYSHQFSNNCEKLNAAAGYVTPYTYATLPGAAGLPAAAAAATAGAAFPGLPYQTTPQEARLQ
ncbi:RNA-binding protein 24-B-like [Vespula squamosa]|uniref:RNA-binding protein 24-B-like n=1 Tax=Vespula squamosa TaxID=30214 RepID=A0ABD2APY9_VESSQ